jgi:hypothetical protein
MDEQIEAVRADYVDAVLNPSKMQSYLLLMDLQAQLRPAAVAPYMLVAVPPPALAAPLRLLAVLIGEFNAIVREGRL